MSADVVQSTCEDNVTCTFRPGQCTILNTSPLGYQAKYVCGYSDGTNTYLCNPGCCPGGVAQGFCPNAMQPPPTCTNKDSCDAEYSSKPCKPHQLADGRYACGYIESTKTNEYGIIDMFFFCNPGCSKCKGTGAVGPCPGQSTTIQEVSYNNKRPVANPWMSITADNVQEPMISRYFYAVIILLIALVIAGTVALI